MAAKHVASWLATALILVFMAVPAHAASTITWTVDRASDDANDGKVPDHRGSLRFVLKHATAGDFVQFGDIGANAIYAASPLIIPDGVAVGRRPGAACGDRRTPLVTIQALTSSVSPVIRMGNNTTLRNVSVAGGDVSVKAPAADVDICAVTLRSH